ncbi:MAG: class I SAM-dependent methyltransferase [Anaerolineales bacterium]|nr:class I SAM-dependent methyltransferase [Anaerolineales bacterium]
MRYITPTSVALDVGCGDGAHYGRLLAGIAREYHGLEISEMAVQVAQQNGIIARQHDLLTAFPYADHSFDVVLCIEVMEHLFEPSFVLAEMRRVLKPAGHIIISVPNIAHFSHRIRAVLGGFAPGGTPETSSRRPWADPHIRFFTVRSLKAFLAEHDMQPVELHGEGLGLFSTLPVISRLASRFVGWERLERWSQPFEFLAHWYPSLLAGSILIVAKPICT